VNELSTIIFSRGDREWSLAAALLRQKGRDSEEGRGRMEKRAKKESSPVRDEALKGWKKGTKFLLRFFDRERQWFVFGRGGGKKGGNLAQKRWNHLMLG